MAIKKISEFSPVDNIAFGDIFLTSYFNVTEYESRYIKAEDILAAGTKVFRAFISQTGMSAPVTNPVKDNYMDGTFSANYSSAGTYTLDGFNGYLDAHTTVTINSSSLNYGEYIKTYITSTDQLTIETYDNTGALADDIMNVDGIFIEITTFI